MTIKYITRDFKITAETEKSVEKKLSQRLRKYNQNNQNNQNQDGDKVITVRITEKKPHTRVDVEMMYLNYHVHAEAVTTDGVLGGIDKCLDIIDRQIEKYKTRIHRSVRQNKGLNKSDFADIELETTVGAASSLDDEPAYKIVKVENHKLEPMSIDEAVLQMEVLDYKFLFFLNAETDIPSVIYKRDDGNIGLIESE